MKSNSKLKVLILISFACAFIISPLISNFYNNNVSYNDKSSEYNQNCNFDNESLKIAQISEKIHIDNNWSATKTAGICTGQGTYSDPYILEDIVINGEDSGSCILIENSSAYFKIENCTLYNSGSNLSHAGISLNNTDNGYIINSNCSSNFMGLYLENSRNITISGNIINYNIRDGIYLYNSDYNTVLGNGAINYNYYGIGIYYSNNNNISGNTVNNNSRDGLYLYLSLYNTISENLLKDSGFEVHGSIGGLGLNDIDTSNLVNGNPLYYYTNKLNLGPDNFTNAGQVILVNCNDSLISNLDVSHSSMGMSLYYCNNNTISGNTADNNTEHGIYLYYCDNNTVMSNYANYNNDHGIYLCYSNNNTVSGNNINNNTEYGIVISHSNGNTIAKNNASNNWVGIYLVGSNRTIIEGNNVLSNDYGIYLYLNNNNTISGNYITDNNGYGIVLSHSNSNTIAENSASNNWVGIYLVGSNRTIIQGNIVLNNDYGIYLYLNNNNTVTGNIASNNWIGIYLNASNRNVVHGNTLNGNKKKAFEEENCKENIIKENIIKSSFPSELIMLYLIIGVVAVGFSAGTIIWIKNISPPKEMKKKGLQAKKEEIGEKEKSKLEKQSKKIENKLRRKIKFVDNLIIEGKMEKALRDLSIIRDIAKSHDLLAFMNEAEQKIIDCKKLELGTIRKIKQTITNLSMKVARVQLTDISEKSAIKDEALIEKVVLEMIRNKDIHGEYFASSKALAFEVGAPISISGSKPEKEIHVFLSYSTLDTDHFEISRIVRRLGIYPEIRNVYSWEADSGENIVTYMEQTLKKTNVFVLFCSESSMKSKAVEDEWQAAFQLRKEGLMKLVPVYEKDEFIPYLLKPILNVKFTKEDFDGFIDRLYNEILRK